VVTPEGGDGPLTDERSTGEPEPLGEGDSSTSDDADEGSLDASIEGSADTAPDAIADVAPTDAADAEPGPVLNACDWENPLPQGEGLTDVWASSKTDAWAVGFHGTILHWNGLTWRPYRSPTFNDLLGVGGSGANDVWAVGYKNTLLHWNGVKWSIERSDEGTSGSFVDVCAIDASNAWIVGSGGFFHWDGHVWNAIPLTEEEGLGADLTAVSATSEDDVWVGVREASSTHEWEAVYHWNGTEWTVPQGFPGSSPPPSSVSRIHALSPKDAWLTSHAEGAAYHWDGVEWTRYSTPARGLWAFDDDNVWASGNRVFHLPSTTPVTGSVDNNLWRGSYDGIGGSAPDDVWFVDPFYASILHWDGSELSAFSQLKASTRLLSIWGTADDDYWTVGEKEAWHRTPSGWVPLPTSEASGTRVWGVGPDDIWLAGALASPKTAYHYTGGKWLPTTGPIALKAVWGASSEDVWGVGNGIQHWDGNAWQVVASPPMTSLEAIWGSSRDDIWAVGMGGKAVHWDGQAWQNRDLGVTWELKGVWAAAPDDVWVVGWATGILHWDGAQWTRFVPLTFDLFYGVWGRNQNDVWAVGRDLLWHYDGLSWRVVAAPPLPGPRGVWGLQMSSVVHIVGERGVVLRCHG
jgi:hypothetical protein